MTDICTDQVFSATDMAVALRQAMGQGVAVDAAGWPTELSAAQILAVQQQQTRLWGEGADAPRYWKSGGPARDLSLNHAPLPPARVYGNDADMRAVPFLLRRVEAEIALRLACDVDASAAQALQAGDVPGLLDSMAVSIEIVDSRWQQQLQAPDSLKAADLLCHGALVLGEWQPYATRDWSQQACQVRIGEQPVIKRTGTHSLQDPVWLLPQGLRHATQHFGTVRRGTVVTTGSWVGLLEARAGDAVQVSFDGMSQLRVQL